MDEYVLVGGPSGGMKGMGWLPDYPDFRDFTPESEEIKPILDKTSAPGLDSVVTRAVEEVVADGAVGQQAAECLPGEVATGGGVGFNAPTTTTS